MTEHADEVMQAAEAAHDAEYRTLVDILAAVVDEQMALIRQQHTDLMALLNWQQAQLNRYQECVVRPQAVWQEGKP